MKEVLILGAGAMGIAAGVLSLKQGNQVTVWTNFEGEVAQIRYFGENRKCLPGVEVPDSLEFITRIPDSVSADAVFFAVPSFVVRHMARSLAGRLDRDAAVICLSDGLEEGSGKTMKEVLDEELPEYKKVYLGFTGSAPEIVNGFCRNAVAAGDGRSAGVPVHECLSRELLCGEGKDGQSVSLACSLKNVLLLASGLMDEEGQEMREEMLNGVCEELILLGKAMGADEKTLTDTGLCYECVCDMKEASHDYQAGALLRKGIGRREITGRIPTAESLTSLDLLLKEAGERGVSLQNLLKICGC